MSQQRQVDNTDFLTTPNMRIGVIAGSGQLPIDLIEKLNFENMNPFVIAVAGEADERCHIGDHIVLTIEQFVKLTASFRQAKVTHVVMVGGISRRPNLRKLTLNWSVFRSLPKAISALRCGDDVLLRFVIDYIERAGMEVVGIHQVMPELLAPVGVLGKISPKKGDWLTISAGFTAAKAIGKLDIGQAAVAFGKRAIALEGIEGTQGLLERTKSMRDHGRLAMTRRGALVKCSKPDQEMRADLPSIGIDTIKQAHQAGLSGIAIEADYALILQANQTIELADELGLYVVGVRENDL